MVKRESPRQADAAERARAGLRVVSRTSDGAHASADQPQPVPDREQVLRDGAGFYVMTASGAVSVDPEHGRTVEPATGASLGISVVQRGASSPSRLRLEPHGLVILTVTPQSRAARAGLRPGDVIERVNREPLVDIGKLRDAVSSMETEPLLLQIVRHDTRFFITANVW